MPRAPKNAFADVVDDDEVEEVQESVVTDDLRTARVKGTWTMYWGRNRYDFEDGKRYKIPLDLYNYLKSRANIYDTLA